GGHWRQRWCLPWLAVAGYWAFLTYSSVFMDKSQFAHRALVYKVANAVAVGEKNATDPLRNGGVRLPSVKSGVALMDGLQHSDHLRIARVGGIVVPLDLGCEIREGISRGCPERMLLEDEAVAFDGQSGDITLVGRALKRQDANPVLDDFDHVLLLLGREPPPRGVPP